MPAMFARMDRDSMDVIAGYASSSSSVVINYVVPALVLLGILIFVHELGHFLLAKLCGVRVLKFSLGFGPKLIGKTIGDTEYVLSALPLGGYVKPLGESPDDPVSEADRPFALNSQGVGARLMILAAGSVFNIMFAAFLYALVYMVGMPVLTTLVGQIIDNSPAARAGIAAGDRIEAIDGREVTYWDDLQERVSGCGGRELRLDINRNGERLTLTLQPELKQREDEVGREKDTYLIGVAPSADGVVSRRYSPLVAIGKAGQEVWKHTKLTFVVLGMLITSPVEKKELLGGPILIGKIAGDIARLGIVSFLLLMAVISLNLGIFNLLPIPILDGGHILFLLIESVKGSPVSTRIMEISHQVGLALLLALMLFVCYNDVIRLSQNLF
jgi:regulator of sigma E protease